MSTFAHTAEQFTAQELLAALVAERLEQLVNKLIDRGTFRLALLGSKQHTLWLDHNIEGMAGVPMDLYLSAADPALKPNTTFKDAPVLALDDPRVPTLIDAVLIADDKHEKPLFNLARTTLPPSIILHTLYDRLPIGNDPLPATTPSANIEPKSPTITAAPVAPLNTDNPRSLNALIAGVALPV